MPPPPCTFTDGCAPTAATLLAAIVPVRATLQGGAYLVLRRGRGQLKHLTMLALFACGPTEGEVLRAVQDANYCSSTDECVRVGEECPFGCNIYVNEAEAEDIRERLEDFDGECQYKCDGIKGAECIDGVCETEAG